MKRVLVAAPMLALVLFLTPWSRSRQDIPVQAKSQSGKRFSVPANQVLSRRNERSATPQPSEWYKSPEWILVLVGVITAFVIAWQSFETRRSVRTATASANMLVASERAWLSVKRIGNPPDDWVSRVSAGYIPGIVFEFTVSGKTVARIVDVRIAMRFIAAKSRRGRQEPDLPQDPDYSDIIPYEIAGSNRVVVPPGGTFQVQELLRDSTPTQAQMQTILEGSNVMCAYGYIRYQDAFEKTRETRICYVYDFAFGGVLKSPDGAVLNPVGFRPGGPPEYNKAT